MPVTKSAIKKLKQDHSRSAHNNQMRVELESTIKQSLKIKKEAELAKAMSLLDKSVKNNIIHKNKAARIKSRLAKLIAKPVGNKAENKPITKPSPPSAARKKSVSKKTASV